MDRGRANEPNYVRIIREVFRRHHASDAPSFDFTRGEIRAIAGDLGVKVPDNLGDTIYALRHGRLDLPDDIKALAPSGASWLLLPNGKGHYRFRAAARAFIQPESTAPPILIPDATPQILNRYMDLKDEQAVLARILYCRLIDIFLGVAAYRLQSHLRTTVSHFNKTQIEIDEVYVATGQTGAHFILPVQAKGLSPKERISAVQLITDYFWCIEKHPHAVPRVLAAKIVEKDSHAGYDVLTIALVEASVNPATYDVQPVLERHFKLVPSAMLDEASLRQYRDAYEAAGTIPPAHQSAGKDR
jgi:hypothetical protein